MSAAFDEQIVTMLTTCQDRLLAYILTLVPHETIAHDILQETNVVLWRRRNEFQLGTSFTAWAYKVSYIQVRAYWRDRGRDRHRFSEDVLALLAEESIGDVDQLEERRNVLAGCLEKLPSNSRQIIEKRYTAGTSLKLIATEMGLSEGAAATAIYRIRTLLRNCVTKQLTGGMA